MVVSMTRDTRVCNSENLGVRMKRGNPGSKATSRTTVKNIEVKGATPKPKNKISTDNRLGERNQRERRRREKSPTKGFQRT